MTAVSVKSVILLQSPRLARWRLVALGLAALPCLALLYLHNPDEGGFFPPCPFFALTDLHCPGCGALRALHQLLNGNLLAAFGHNLYAMLALPVIGYTYLSGLLLSVSGRQLPALLVPPNVTWWLPAAITAFWILRNVPVYPFTVLAP